MNKSSVIELLKNYRFYKSRRVLLEKTLKGNNHSVDIDKLEAKDLNKEMELELFRLDDKIDKVETYLKFAGEYDERYRILIESHYVNSVRIEDIADMTHMSRSRCYELCSEAIKYISRIIFGEKFI